MEERLIDLETRLVFQEDSIETLSNLLTDQQAQLDLLLRRIESITDLLRKMMEPNSSEDLI